MAVPCRHFPCCPPRKARLRTSLGVHPQPHVGQGGCAAGCSEGERRSHGRAWGTRQRGQTCSAESRGRRASVPAAAGREGSVGSRAGEGGCGSFGRRPLPGPVGAGVGSVCVCCCCSSSSQTHPRGTTPQLCPRFLRHPEQARSCGDAHAAGTVPSIPLWSGGKPPLAGIYSSGSELAQLGKVLFSVVNHEAT